MAQPQSSFSNFYVIYVYHQPLSSFFLFFSSFLLKDGHGIFNLRNDLSGSACCAREGETGTGDDFALHE